MSVIEAVTMAAGLAYLVLLAWQARSGWQWRLALGLLLMLWLLAADSLLWLGVGLVAAVLVFWHQRRPLPALEALDSQWLRTRTRQLLLLCWGLVTLQYGLHVWQLGQGMSPWLVRPDVVDGFLPIAGGLGLRAWLGQGLVDPHHPAATVTVLVLSLSALLLGRVFCAWFCPLGLVGEWLHGLRSRWITGEWTPPRWLDVVLRGQKFLVLAFLLFIVLIAVPGAALPGYFTSPYHQAADMKMGAFFFNLTLISALCLGWVLLLTATFRQGFCRYLCPYGAWLALLGLLTPLRIRRDPARCLRSAGHDCDKCSRACPSRIQVHQLIAVRSLECTSCLSCVAACPKRADALHLGTQGRRLAPRQLLGLLCLLLLVLPLLAYGLLGIWVSLTPLADRAQLLQLLPQLTH
ncbi:4Fe-4S binding protein [Aeromonas hydrophila]|uniref:Iron-sulfur cluster-binding protein n=1 Tax=Aeromonas hydrophila subsp. hydrophila (strain ATCC 7966 / DSM 30187 / BCRC 13018 / CCUG 14551 / JCM 1027 / KCTC 2358 / NCIMB 9240 / NCTC 8049) TaxID=380703 RepID=A0KEJ4_AERHH|nr:4Fe-4S binding protein [Aeromonas hydrophila]ABK38976.1 iron-sulfur cluster-binding protein [Aeromonas hydrophila subsp. hydrophila ATCC 7966]MBS4674131.1 4Fe-4S binding protein [Aeromonas hydrophila]OOD31020.1 ferredoxin [Aeromonas hydrophila]SUU12440.1 (Fe-S)-binding protein [Aeromonas hydrophila]